MIYSTIICEKKFKNFYFYVGTIKSENVVFFQLKNI